MEVDKESASESMSDLCIRNEIVFIIVEDERGHYILTKHYLRKAGIENEILWFEDGQSVLDSLYGDGHPSNNSRKYVMLLDIRLPKVDGIEVLKKIKQDENLQHIPVIILTSAENPQQAKLCEDLRCEAYVIKPPGEVLLNAIQRAVSKF